MARKPATDIRVVKKTWGEEHWIVNDSYCGKKLVFRRGFRSSLHRHALRDETFYLLSGRMVLEFGGREQLLLPGMKLHVPVNCQHRLNALEDSELIEFSTTHPDAEADALREVLAGRIPAGHLAALNRKYPRVPQRRSKTSAPSR